MKKRTNLSKFTVQLHKLCPASSPSQNHQGNRRKQILHPRGKGIALVIPSVSFKWQKYKNLEREEPTAVDSLLGIIQVFSSYKLPVIPWTEDDWQLQSPHRYILTCGFLHCYSDKEKRNRQWLCVYNSGHLSEHDRVPGPHLGKASPGVTGEQSTVELGHPNPLQAPLSMPRGGGGPSLLTFPPAEKGGIPSDFLLFWDEWRQPVSLCLLEDHRHLWQPQHGASTNQEQKITTTS